MTKILIIEDEVMIAEDLAEICKSFGYEVLETAYTPGDAIHKLQSCEIDLVLLDINLESELNGFEIAEYINRHLSLPIIYISSYTDIETLSQAKKTKPMAYLTKPFKRSDIYSTIEFGLENWKRLNFKSFPSLESINKKLANELTKREYGMLKELYDGRSNQEIADHLFISLNTVKSHLRNCYNKLGVNSRNAALSMLRHLD